MTDNKKMGGINNALQQDIAVQNEQKHSNLERNGKDWNDDFEQEWKRYFEHRGEVATVNIKDLARHFAEWQREQMMRNAVVGTVEWSYLYRDNDYGVIEQKPFNISERGLKEGDTVKLIIVKED